MKYSYEFKKECVQLYREGKWPETPEGIKQQNFHKLIKCTSFKKEAVCMADMNQPPFNTADATMPMGGSEFRDGLVDYIGRAIIGTVLTECTLGIMFPWAVVLIKRWEINNTYIDGRRLRFDGTAMGLFGNYIKWWFLTLITLGIYGFWGHIKMRQWVVKHNHLDR